MRRTAERLVAANDFLEEGLRLRDSRAQAVATASLASGVLGGHERGEMPIVLHARAAAVAPAVSAGPRVEGPSTMPRLPLPVKPKP